MTPKSICLLSLLLAVWMYTAPYVRSDDDTLDMDDVLEGFEDPSPSQNDTSDQTGVPPSERIFYLDGYVQLLSTWNYEHTAPDPGLPDHRGISMIRPEALLELKVNLPRQWRLHVGGHFFYDAVYWLKDDDAYSDDYLETYQWEAEWHEVYFSGKLGSHLDLKIGRQIAVWGRSDMIRVVDCLNPLDMRYPGMTDIVDLRLPVTMTRLDGYWGPFHMGVFGIHEPRFNKEPVFGSDFYPAAAPAPKDDKLGWDLANTQWAATLGGVFHGLDVSLYWADLYSESAHVELEPDFFMTRRHARLTLWGAAGNFAWGAWLLKGEAAWRQGNRFFNGGDKTYDRLDGIVGIEYGGWTSASLGIEAAIRYYPDFDQALEQPPDYADDQEYQWALRFDKMFLNDTLQFGVLAAVYGPLGQTATFERLTMTYDWTDNFATILGVLLYQADKEGPMGFINDNDRLYLAFKYHF